MRDRQVDELVLGCGDDEIPDPPTDGGHDEAVDDAQHLVALRQLDGASNRGRRSSVHGVAVCTCGWTERKRIRRSRVSS